jgi:hypothetical protein
MAHITPRLSSATVITLALALGTVSCSQPDEGTSELRLAADTFSAWSHYLGDPGRTGCTAP